MPHAPTTTASSGATWLSRSGQLWIVRADDWATGVGIAALGGWFLGVDWLRQTIGSWALAPAILGFLSLTAALALPLLVRCRVCGLHLESFSQVRRLTRAERAEWLASLQHCPVCGDSGEGSKESRERWLHGGGHAEAPYWSAGRIVLLVALAVVILSASVLIGLRIR